MNFPRIWTPSIIYYNPPTPVTNQGPLYLGFQGSDYKNICLAHAFSQNQNTLQSFILFCRIPASGRSSRTLYHLLSIQSSLITVIKKKWQAHAVSQNMNPLQLFFLQNSGFWQKFQNLSDKCSLGHSLLHCHSSSKETKTSTLRNNSENTSCADDGGKLKPCRFPDLIWLLQK